MLLTSQTLTSTLRSCFSLRILSFWPLLLILIWALSPIGGQAALRAIESEPDIVVSEYPLISYATSNNLSIFLSSAMNIPANGAELKGSMRASIAAVFTAHDSTLSHANGSSEGFVNSVNQGGGDEQVVKSCRRDLWRNIRIPFLHSLPGYQSSNRFEWLDISQDFIPDTSSLIGVPIRGFPSTKSGNTTFTLQSNYQLLEVRN